MPLPGSPGGTGVSSSILTATWWPVGVVSTRLPSPPLTVRMSPPGAIASPSGAFSLPPVETVRPALRAGVTLVAASLIAAIRLNALSAT